MRNTIRFLLGNIYDFSPSEAIEYDNMREIDRYAISNLNETITIVTNAYEAYEFHNAAVQLNLHCTVFLSNFYLDALKDILYCEKPGSTARKSAQRALWETCSALIRLMAPILPFTTEEAWQELRKIDKNLPESVFFAEFPKPDSVSLFSTEQEKKWEKLMSLREKVSVEFEKLRKEKKIGSNLEASVNMYDNGNLGSIDKEVLCNVLGTWDVVVSAVADPGAKPEELQVSAGVSNHVKCERCWRHVKDVNASNKHGANLCGRCVEALG